MTTQSDNTSADMQDDTSLIINSSQVANLIEQFEIPEEYHHAMWEAYSQGAQRGFMKGLEATPKEELKDE